MSIIYNYFKPAAGVLLTAVAASTLNVSLGSFVGLFVAGQMVAHLPTFVQNCVRMAKERCAVSLDLCNAGLTQIDLLKYPRLITLFVENNKLKELDISNNPELVGLSAENNLLEELDISQNPSLTHLFLKGNHLTELDVSHNPCLQMVILKNNWLETLHDSIFRLPRTCTVDVRGNFFTRAYCLQIRENIARVRQENPNLGPKILFDLPPVKIN